MHAKLNWKSESSATHKSQIANDNKPKTIDHGTTNAAKLK